MIATPSLQEGLGRLRRDAGCFEGLLFAVVVIGADDLVVSEAIDERVLAIKLDTAAHSLRVHANNDDHSVAGVYELLRLEAPLGPRVSPVPEPAFNASAPPIRALVRGVVVVDLDPLVEHVPGQLSGRKEA